jgi:radical SAM-linked protein
VVQDLDKEAFPDNPIIPFGRPVHDRLRLEVARGCTRGCRFCQAGMIYRPVRERSPNTLLTLADRSLKHTGYEDLSLLSLSTGDYGCIEGLMQALIDRCTADHIAISLPSLRAGTLTPELMGLIKKVRKTGFTIAPEAGSQRLRNAINKNICEKEIVETVENAFALGWQVIKLYFMVGLPTETEEDLNAIFNLVQQLRHVKKPDRRRCQINVSVATFIPKPHTPFQWADQIPLDAARQKIRRLRDKLKAPGIQFKWQPPEVSQIEGLWARGDRRLAQLLIKAYRLGCRFDGWSDHFNHSLWQEACRLEGVSIESSAEQQRELSETLPWDHIDTGVSKEYLQKEYHKALSGELTEDCRTGTCNHCSVCDFEKIAPVLFSQCDADWPIKTPPMGATQPGFRKLLVTFSKTGSARFLGHLEMANIFARVFRRSGVRLKYSEGYHPQPKLAFLDALPVGMESHQEYLVITVSGEVDTGKFVSCLNSNLPEGLKVIDCCHLPPGTEKAEEFIVTYRVVSDDGIFDDNQIDAGMKKSEWIVERTNRKGKVRHIDLRPFVLGLERVSASELNLTLKSTPGHVVRPGAVVAYLFGLLPDNLRYLRTTKMGNRF